MGAGSIRAAFTAALCVSISFAGTSSPLAAQSAAFPQTAPVGAGWGLLGEMVDRDFEGPNYLLTVRWLEPGRRMQLVKWGGGGRDTVEIELDPATGKLTRYLLGTFASYGTPLKSAADGSILIEGNKGKVTEWLGRGPDGGLVEHYGRAISLQPVTKRAKLLASLIAKGKLQPAAMAAAPSPTLAAAAKPAERLVLAESPRATPMKAGTLAMAAAPNPSGLQGLIGGHYLDTGRGMAGQLVQTRWIVPGREFEVRYQGEHGGEGSTRFAISENGAIEATQSTASSGITGHLDQAGLPVMVQMSDGKLRQSRFQQTPTGYLIIDSENRAKNGKPPKWKDMFRTDRKPISDSEWTWRHEAQGNCCARRQP